jgi:hypothetical protein
VSPKADLLRGILSAVEQGGNALVNVLRQLPQQDAQTVRQVLRQAAPASRVMPDAGVARQLPLPLRESAGARSLAPTATRGGRVTPAGAPVGGRMYSPGTAASPRNVETVRLSQQPRAVDTPTLPAPAPRGQLSTDSAPIPAFGEGFRFPSAPSSAVVQLSPRAQQLAQTDPGTFNSIRQLAARAEDFYGIRQGGLVNALVEPGGTDVLRYLEAGDDLATAVNRASGGGGLVRAGSSEMMTPGGQMVRSPGGQAVASDIVDVDIRDLSSPMAQAQALRNSAGGVQMGNLSRMMDPNLLALMGGGAAAGLALGNIGNIVSSFNEGGSAPVEGAGNVPMDYASAPVLFRDNSGAPLGEGPVAYAPPAPGRMTGDPTQPAPVITRGDERSSARREALAQYAPTEAAMDRALEPKDPSQYRSIEDYYKARNEYASAPAKRKELVQAARQMEQEQAMQNNMAAWAAANPQLMYELQRKQMANPAANQQSGDSVTTNRVVAPMGSNTTANAVGNSIAAGEAAVQPSQGAFELMDATRPMEQPELQRVQDLISRMAPRSRTYAGY